VPTFTVAVAVAPGPTGVEADTVGAVG